MPAPPDGSWFDALTPTQQILLNAAFFLVTAVGMAFGYFRKPPGPPASPKDMMLTAAGITDMRPVRELADAVKDMARQQKRTADALEAIQDIMRDRATSEDISRRVKDEVEQRIRDAIENRR